MAAVLSLAQAWLLLGPPVQRPTEGVPLRWEAPAECPDEDALRERVHALVPGLLDHKEVAESRVDAELRATDEGFAATVVVRNREGETRRELVTADCELLTDATALILAVALDPLAVTIGISSGSATDLESVEAATDLESVEANQEPDEPEPVADDPGPDEPEPALDLVESVPEFEREELEPERETRRLRLGTRVFGGGGYGPTNTGYATIGGALALLGERWRAELGGLWATPRTVRVDSGIGGTFTGWAVFGRGCFVPGVRRIDLPLCPGVELGSVRGRGLPELPSSSQASFSWVALGVAQGLWFAPIERVGLGVELDVSVPLNRGTFAVEATPIQRIAAVTVRGLAAVELRW